MAENKKPVIYFLTFALAACSIIYELLIAQTIASFASETVLWYSLTLGVYLLAMGAGVYYFDRRSAGRGDTWQFLGKLEVVLAAAGLMVVIVISTAHMLMTFLWVREHFYLASGVFFGISFMTAFGIGFLSGIELPALMRLASDESAPGGVTNRVLAADYFGCLAGAVLFPLVLISNFGLIQVGIIVASVNALIAAYILLVKCRGILSLRISVFVLVLFQLGFFTQAEKVSQYFLKKFYYYPQQAVSLAGLFSVPFGYPDIEQTRSDYQVMDLVVAPDNQDPFYYLTFAYSDKYKRVTREYPIDRLFYMNKSFQFWVNFEELYHEYFVHVPIHYYRRIPTDVLVLGGGDGLLVRELLKYPNVKNVTVVDIDPEMLRMAKQHDVLVKMNREALLDPRVRTVTADAYQYIRKDSTQYDAIFLDFPDPSDYDISKLYSFEFYTFVKNRLKDEGFMVANVPQMGEVRADIGYESEIVVNTLKAAEFAMVKPFYTRLETDNREAYDILGRVYGDIKEIVATETSIDSGESRESIIKGKDKVFSKIVSDFTSDYTKPFVMAAKDRMPVFTLFAESAIPMDVLNAYRFSLALRSGNMSDAQKKINSILDPELPNRKYWWRPKLPY